MVQNKEMEEYCKLCYDQEMQIFNHGGLCLVHPIYFNLGLEFMTKIRSETNNETFRKEGNKVLKVAIEKLFSDHQCLRKHFDECHIDNNKKHSEFYDVVYKTTLTKTFNARSKVESKHCKAINTGRYAAKSQKTALRQMLQVMEKSKCEKIGNKKQNIK